MHRRPAEPKGSWVNIFNPCSQCGAACNSSRIPGLHTTPTSLWDRRGVRWLCVRVHVHVCVCVCVCVRVQAIGSPLHLRRWQGVLQTRLTNTTRRTHTQPSTARNQAQYGLSYEPLRRLVDAWGYGCFRHALLPRGNSLRCVMIHSVPFEHIRHWLDTIQFIAKTLLGKQVTAKCLGYLILVACTLIKPFQCVHTTKT